MTPPLEHVRVSDAMHHGILACSPEAPLGEVAAIMATHRVHAVAVTDEAGSRPVGVVSDLDVVAAIAAGDELVAREAAATEPLSVSANERLDRAAQLMAEHGVAHLVVLDPADGHPVGVLATSDVASIYAAETAA
jgi:CBS domain-containing protein